MGDATRSLLFCMARNIEQQHQIAFFQILALSERRHPFLKWIYAIPNGSYRGAVVAQFAKAEGQRSGVSDICVPAARRGYFGLYMENKSPTGALSANQKEFQAYVKSEGYCTVVCRSVEEQISMIEWYFEIKLVR